MSEVHPNEELIRRFYAAFRERDPDGMAACYHPQVVFSDPAFGTLRGDEAGDMWAMLIGRATDLEVACDEAHADDLRGFARWHATYTFTQTGRRVLNRIEARFEFQDGLIVRHDDRFDFWKWSRQALGPMGMLLGWSPLLRRRVMENARRGLEAFRAKRGR